MLMSIELMLNAANLTVLAFGAFVAPLKTHAAVIALLVIAVAAAEATAMTSSAITAACVLSGATKAPKARTVRLAALSISSIDISMLIALRRARKPKVPMAKSRPERIRYESSELLTTDPPHGCWDRGGRGIPRQQPQRSAERSRPRMAERSLGIGDEPRPW